MAGSPPPPAQQQLVERLREHLADEPVTRELSMFGGRCFMVAGKILVSAGTAGGILIRVSVDDDAVLLGRAGASRAGMGAGRDMGPGWIAVEASAVRSDEDLRSWLEPALAHNRAVTGRDPRGPESAP